MRGFLRNTGFTLLSSAIFAGAALAQSAPATAVDGRWDAALTHDGLTVPFRLDIVGIGPTLHGVLYNGFRPYDGTTDATFQDGKLTLNIEHYLTTINATLQDGKLVGNVNYQSRSANSAYGFSATRHVESKDVELKAPSIAGSWIIPLDHPTAKGEKAFRFIVEQHGTEVAASILRVDGDTGAYSGTFHDGKWVLSHYDGSRPGVIEVSSNPDGTLQVLQLSAKPNVAKKADSSYGQEEADSRYSEKLVAYRSEVAEAKGLPQPEDYRTHTTVRDPNEPFAFKFPDVDGKLVSSDDPRFKGKVVLAIVTGTWCPNCHDEAQYLVQLDKKYRDKGLAIVALDFEEPEQQGSLEREKAFVKQYGVNYTYLIAGAPSDMWEKVPQLVNLNTWPATVFVGRDGRVRATHSGFASPASGQFNADLEKEFTAQIEQLLSETPKKAAAVNLNTPAKDPAKSGE